MGEGERRVEGSACGRETRRKRGREREGRRVYVEGREEGSLGDASEAGRKRYWKEREREREREGRLGLRREVGRAAGVR